MPSACHARTCISQKAHLRVDNKSAVLFFNTLLDERSIGFKIKQMWVYDSTEVMAKIVSVVTHNALKYRALKMTIFTREGPKLLQLTGGGGGAIFPSISSLPLKGAPFNLINNFLLLLL